jgi:hypothetical protein
MEDLIYTAAEDLNHEKFSSYLVKFKYFKVVPISGVYLIGSFTY